MLHKLQKLRLADYLAAYLKEIGVKNVFMLSGTGSIYLDDAFAHCRGIGYICAKHEAAAAVMAEASAKLTGKIGVVVATTGPGGVNAIGGVVEAWVDSVPILVISGQVFKKQISANVRSYGVQGFNIVENIKNITKYSMQVNNPNNIRYYIEKAIFFSKEGRPGPVWLDIPTDVQSAVINPSKLKCFRFKSNTFFHKKNFHKIDKFFNFLNMSKKPIIVFGQGIRNSKAINEFKLFLKKYKLPSISARMAVDILPYTNPYYFGLGGMRGHRYAEKILKEADLVIALGTSYTHAFAGNDYNYYNSKAKLIMINIDSSELTKPSLNVDLSIVIDVRNFLNELNKDKRANKINIKYLKWLKFCRYQKKILQTCLPSFKKNPINSYYFIEKINNYSTIKDIFISDAGSSNYICSQNLRFKNGQRELTSGAFYSMGMTLPLAIGASVTYPNKRVLAITGDGSIELNIQELRTLSQNKLNIKLFVINNEGYASIRKSQDDMTGSRYFDDRKVLNFSKIAKAFELQYFFVDDYKKLDKTLSKLINHLGPCLVEVVCDPNQEIIETHSV